jgi:hypothetical protein
MTQLKFIFQPPYSILLGAELLTNPETRQIDGFCVHLILISIEISWDDNDYFNLT